MYRHISSACTLLVCFLLQGCIGTDRTPIIVSQIGDEGAGSFRWAVNRANRQKGPDRIIFSVDVGKQVIALNGCGLVINSDVLIDGSTQPGFSGTPLLVIDGSNAYTECTDQPTKFNTSSEPGLILDGSNITIRYLSVTNFGKGPGILIDGDYNLIEGSYIGINSHDNKAAGNLNGITIQSSNNTIGSSNPTGKNVISGNSQYGVVIAGETSTQNRIIGNLIGTDPTGFYSIGNGRTGVLVYNSGSNVIGGRMNGEQNTISGNHRGGVNIDGSATRPGTTDLKFQGGFGKARHNKILGNRIGTDITGTSAIPNKLHGILLFMSQENEIGGIEAGEGNIISGNERDGILISGPNPTRPDWRMAVVDPISGATTITVESEFTQNTDANLLSVRANKIFGNFIGVDFTGLKALPNKRHGVLISFSHENIVGGDVPGAKNILSGNFGNGININGASSFGNRIIGNMIGIGIDARSALPNQQDGIMINGAPETVLDDNTVLSNARHGVHIRGRSAFGQSIHRNIFSLAENDYHALDNKGYSVMVFDSPEAIYSQSDILHDNFFRADYTRALRISPSK